MSAFATTGGKPKVLKSKVLKSKVLKSKALKAKPLKSQAAAWLIRRKAEYCDTRAPICRSGYASSGMPVIMAAKIKKNEKSKQHLEGK
jgi:hypothetical protein